MAAPWHFQGKYVIWGVLHCTTGLHIGGNTEGFEIGGVDNPVMRDPLTDRPYIPGSSLKGKLRHLTEWSLGLIEKHSKHKSYAAYECKELGKPLVAQQTPKDQKKWNGAFTVGRLFGPASDDPTIRETAGPSRLTVRDSFLTDDSVQKLQTWLGDDIFTEIKTENTLDRVTSEATPRPMERVPAGAEFDFTLICDVYDDSDRELLRTLFAALSMLEDSALGGSGSRGHGQIEIRRLKAEWRSLDYYVAGAGSNPIAAAAEKPVHELAKTFQVSDWKV